MKPKPPQAWPVRRPWRRAAVLASPALLLALFGCAQPGATPTPAAAPAKPALVEIEVVPHASTTDTKPLSARFRELERLANHSLVEVTLRSGASVPSAMFALRGSCAVMRARGMAFVASEPVPGSPGRYVLRFPSAPTPAQLTGATKTVFSLAECEMLKF